MAQLKETRSSLGNKCRDVPPGLFRRRAFHFGRKGGIPDQLRKWRGELLPQAKRGVLRRERRRGYSPHRGIRNAPPRRASGHTIRASARPERHHSSRIPPGFSQSPASKRRRNRITEESLFCDLGRPSEFRRVRPVLPRSTPLPQRALF